MNQTTDFLAEVNWNSDGLLPAIAQDHSSGEVLMMAWMNRESLLLTVAEGIAVYWSRSRQQLWRKGETSGHTQKVKAIQLDCDGDTLLLKVEQIGGIACHTGRRSCFFKRFENGSWQENSAIVKDPKEIYK
ncbi:phosphoribosyl-AMP cyclohydrolase [Alteromonadaceae bacterium 2753L.S.0a.02]|nr:phosphoribosyl-AMP cyclohydrolase [Alteromonadaceae bacterium 2753L.S.0a.02]